MDSIVSLIAEIARRIADQRLGADPGDLRRAAHELEIRAEHLRRQTDAMSSELHNAWWQGPDADRFRSDWDQVHRQESRRITDELTQLAAFWRQSAAKQERASGG